MKHNSILMSAGYMMTLVLVIVSVTSFASARTFSEFFDEGDQIVIVTGTYAAVSDIQAADRIAEIVEVEIEPSRDTRIMTDSGINAYVSMFINDEDGIPTDIRIISLGGSCVNGLSAVILELPFPTCDSRFTVETRVAAGEYIIHTEELAVVGSKEMTVTVIAGYDAAETVYAASTLNSSWIDYDVGRSNVLDMS